MIKKRLILISMIIIFILSIGMVSAANDLSGISEDISIDSNQDMLSVESNDLGNANSQLNIDSSDSQETNDEAGF